MPANESARIRYLLDRIEIPGVIARYGRGRDDHQGEDSNVIADSDHVFTADAIVDYSVVGPGNGPFSYRDLAGQMRGDDKRPGVMPTAFSAWQHVLGLPTVTIAGDTATAKTDLLVTHVGRTRTGPSWHLFDAATFHNRLVCTDNG